MDERWYSHPTTRLKAHGFAWGKPPFAPDKRRRLELEADEILRKAHEQIRKHGRQQDADNRWVISLNPDILGVEIPDEPETWPEDEFDKFIFVVQEVAGLTDSETQIVRLVAQSSIQIGAYGGYEAAALHLDKRIHTVRQTWSVAKKKLIQNWAEEPETHVKGPRPRSGEHGTGHRLFIGKPVDWGPIVSPEDKAEAYRNRDLEGPPESDWNYAPSLTEDGWQLGDDHLWATALDVRDLGF